MKANLLVSMYYSAPELTCSFVIIQESGNPTKIKTSIGNVKVKLIPCKNEAPLTYVEVIYGNILEGDLPVVTILVPFCEDFDKWKKWLNDNTPKPARVLPPEPQQSKPDPNIELPR